MNNLIQIELPGVHIVHPKACVVVIRYDSECNITLELAQQITREVRQLYQDDPIGVVHSAGASTTLEPGVREYLSSNARYPNKVAEAFVVKNLSQRIIANFYLRVSRHTCPTEVFNEEQDAIKWINGFCPHAKGRNAGEPPARGTLFGAN
jgi:hypothetical protein